MEMHKVRSSRDTKFKSKRFNFGLSVTSSRNRGQFVCSACNRTDVMQQTLTKNDITRRTKYWIVVLTGRQKKLAYLRSAMHLQGFRLGVSETRPPGQGRLSFCKHAQTSRGYRLVQNCGSIRVSLSIALFGPATPLCLLS